MVTDNNILRDLQWLREDTKHIAVLLESELGWFFANLRQGETLSVTRSEPLPSVSRYPFTVRLIQA